MGALRPLRVATTLCAVGAIAVSLPGGAAAAPRAHAALPVVSPYVDTSLSGEYGTVYNAITSAQLRNITAGFIVAQPHSCVPEWGGGTAVSNDPGVSRMIKTARRDGASVIVSFGGESGSEIATTCSSQRKLTAAYRSVVSELHVTHLDFDIEGHALTKPASIARRFAAIHALEAGNHSLVVSLTVPVTPTGLDQQGRKLLRAAKHAKARVDLLNVMAMDYGGRHEMATAAERAANDTLAQFRRVSPHATYRSIGITAMIGHNDVYNEIFTSADAHHLVKFAKAHHVGRLGFWSIDRDQKCSGPETTAQFDCSGVTQSALQFTHIFAG